MSTIAAGTGDAAVWPFALAKKVNGASEIFRIGVLRDCAGRPEVAPVKSVDENRVCRGGEHAGFTCQIDIDTP